LADSLGEFIHAILGSTVEFDRTRSGLLAQMNSDFEAVLFDMDGVLADSEELWTEIDAQLLGEHGVAYAGEHKADVLGTNFPAALGFYRKRYELRTTIEELILRRHQIAADFYATRIGMFASAPRVLQTLKQRGYKIALATSSIRPLAEPWLARHELAQYFNAVTTGEEVKNGKPAPDIYLEAARRVGIAPENCLVVEDALAGVQSGKSAGMTVFAIPDARWVDVQKFNGFADKILASLDELPDAIA
jgi:16S rRNA pseudouridine516 synthase